MGIEAPGELRLVEVAFYFHVPVPGSGDWNQVVVHAGLLCGRLHLSFSISGPAEERETLPATLVDGIRAGLEYAGKNVRERDLTEFDPDPDPALTEVRDRSRTSTGDRPGRTPPRAPGGPLAISGGST